MRKIFSQQVESHRVAHPINGIGDSNNGCFVFKEKNIGVIVSRGMGWENVSVSKKDHSAATWEEMCWVKDLFFSDDEWVMQYHPAKKDYIDYGINVLHLWRPTNGRVPKPAKWMV